VFLADAANFIAQTTTTAVEAANNSGATSVVPATAPTTQEAPGIVRFIQSLGGMFPLVIVMILFIWMTTKSKRKQEKQKKDMLGAMKRGDRVQTIGGILGNIVETRDDRILVKVDETNNTKVWFARSAIHRVLGEEAEAK
jgi:preprotein translocase subunit YajC